jgi:hypothetical protein
MVVMTADPAVDEAIARVEEQLGVVFNRARLVWKQAAEQIHPDLQPAGYKVLYGARDQPDVHDRAPLPG